MDIELKQVDSRTYLEVFNITPKEGAQIFMRLSTAPITSSFGSVADLDCVLAGEIVKQMAPLLTGLIPAIKLYRHLTGAGLRASKDAVEALNVRFHVCGDSF